MSKARAESEAGVPDVGSVEILYVIRGTMKNEMVYLTRDRQWTLHERGAARFYSRELGQSLLDSALANRLPQSAA